jgi:LPS O-antigen subunit length determinant protein (WzzB/FepE family)
MAGGAAVTTAFWTICGMLLGAGAVLAGMAMERKR